MSEESKKVTYIETSEHAMVGGSAPLEPGGRVLVDDENESHKHLKRLIEAEDPSVEHLSLVEVDPKAEKDAAKEKEEMLEEAAKIAAEVRNEEARKASEAIEEQLEASEGQQPHQDEPVLPPQDEESVRIAKKSGAGQRASTQEDVVEEQGSKSGRRSARSKGSD